MTKHRAKHAPTASKIQSIVLIAFGMLCLIFSMFLSSGSGDPYKKTIPASGGIIGPFETNKAHSVFQISIKQSVNMGNWSYVNVELLDQNQEYLYSFGKELWSESGYDDEGAWSERQNDYDIKITIKDPGTYHLKVSSESNAMGLSNIHVKMQKKVGSNLAFLVAGIMSLLLGLANDFFRSSLLFK